jgi:hypothetical protein
MQAARNRRPAVRLLPAILALAVGLPAVVAARDILGTETKRYSQQDEELIIRDFFQDRRGGFFVDVGCAWPIRNNTTYYLEKHLGWSGIGIDGLPDYGPWWKEVRPHSKFFHRIVTNHSGTVESFYRAAWPGISSIEKGRVVAGRPVKQQEIKVQTTTLNDLLEQEGVEKIDFLSMDIEEAEPLALEGFDIQKYRPELVCIEAAPAVRKQLRDYFEKNDYERIEKYRDHDQRNWYLTPRKKSAKD